MYDETFIPSRELKIFFKALEAQYGAVPAVFEECAFVRRKERICMMARDVDKIPREGLRVNSLGLYVAEVKGDQLRLSIEGSQLIGPIAKRNVHEIDKEQLKEWFQGKDIKIEKEYEGFVILKHNNDFVGSGKFKEGFILNFVPKARRIMEMH